MTHYENQAADPLASFVQRLTPTGRTRVKYMRDPEGYDRRVEVASNATSSSSWDYSCEITSNGASTDDDYTGPGDYTSGSDAPGRLGSQSIVTSEYDIDEINELAEAAVSDDTDDLGWGLTAPPTVSGTNPGMLQGCSNYSAIYAQPPEQHYNICMISAARSVGRGRGHGAPPPQAATDAVGITGAPAAGTDSVKQGSADGPTDRQGTDMVPPTDRSNFVAPRYGGARAGVWQESTTYHSSGALPDDERFDMSMPRLTDYDREPAMRRELEQRRQEYELRLEIERLRYERSLAEEAAQHEVARLRLEMESERARVAQRVDYMQLSAVAGATSSDGSVVPLTPVKLRPLDSTVHDLPVVSQLLPRRLDRRSAGAPPAGAEDVRVHQSQTKHTMEKETADEFKKATTVRLPADIRSGQDQNTQVKVRQPQNPVAPPVQKTAKPPEAGLLSARCNDENRWVSAVRSPQATHSAGSSSSDDVNTDEQSQDGERQ